jgi:hypothetical protein
MPTAFEAKWPGRKNEHSKAQTTLFGEPMGLSDFEKPLTDLIEHFKASGRPLDEAIEALERALSDLRNPGQPGVSLDAGAEVIDARLVPPE